MGVLLSVSIERNEYMQRMRRSAQKLWLTILLRVYFELNENCINETLFKLFFKFAYGALLDARLLRCKICAVCCMPGMARS